MPKVLTHYAVFANGELQIIEMSEASAKREMRDLRIMECDGIKCFAVTGEGVDPSDAIDNIENVYRDGKTCGKKTLAKFEEACNVVIRVFTL